MADQSTPETQAEDAAIREAFRKLGYQEDLLTRAISACGTVERAEQWLEVLGPLALESRYVYEIAMSKLEPADYLRWHRAGLGPLDALQSPRHFAKAGLSVDDYLRWRSAGFREGLGGFVPHLMAGLSFDELLHVLTEWNKGADTNKYESVREFKEMLLNGLVLDEFRQQLATGLSGQQIYTWRKAGVPTSTWQRWMNLGFDAKSAVEYSRAGIAASAAKAWADIGISPKDASAFVRAQVPVTTAREWISAGIAGTGVLIFIVQGVPLEEAQIWVNSGLSPQQAVDYIEKGVSIDDALDFDERGITSWQVERTKSGLKLNLDPWQEDPADQLPKVIKPGRITLTLWTDALGGDPQAHDISLKWDGHHTVEWFEDISLASGDLSPASSSPTWGVASWPNGQDVLLTYTWSEMGLQGHARLAGAAPRSGSQGAGGPRDWIRFGEALVEFVLLDLGSGNHERNELASEYYCPARDEMIELDDIFRMYLDAAEKTEVAQEFEEWLSAGIYTTDVDATPLDDETTTAAAAEPPQFAAKSPTPTSPPPTPLPSRGMRRGGLGINQRRILDLLRTAAPDGLSTAELAKSLGISADASAAALKGLEKRRLVVLTTYKSIAWLPERRLAWLQTHAASTPSALEEIAELSALVEDQRAASGWV